MSQLSNEIDSKAVSELTERFLSSNVSYIGSDSVIDFLFPIARQQVARILNTDIETLQPYLVTIIDNIANNLTKRAAENVMTTNFEKCSII